MQSLRVIKSTFHLRRQVAKATLNFSEPPSPATLQAIGEVIEARSRQRSSRVSQLVGCETCKLFLKIQRIETLPKKLRVMLGRRKRSGRFDWPLEELLNTFVAAELGINGVKVIGFGMVKPKFGIVRDFVLLTEFLEQHLNGLQWLERHPENAVEFVQRCMDLIVSMNDRGFTHLDLWIANIMVPGDRDQPLRVIDMENAFTRQPAFTAETLGLQLGFLYRKDLHRFIDEALFDNIVNEFMRDRAAVDGEAFERMYAISKHRKLSHRKRRKVFLKGILEHA